MQVRPHLFVSLASLPSTLTSLGVFGDSWDALQLSKVDLDPLGQLTGLQHLGLHHYEIAGSADSFSSGFYLTLNSNMVGMFMYTNEV